MNTYTHHEQVDSPETSKRETRESRSATRVIDGVLNIDKPEGLTSMDVVRHIKRVSRVKRVGHGGTLDPFATGVIVICLGQGTKMMQDLVDGSKIYRGVVELGVETDTYDVQGAVIRRMDASEVTLDGFTTTMGKFIGVIDQVPPMYSALKRQGKRLYELARAGVEIDRDPRRVEVNEIKVIEWNFPLVEIEVRCGRGFYMRSLAHDLGEKLGCGAHLKSLKRIKNGPFYIGEALTLQQVEKKFGDSSWKQIVRAPDTIVSHLRTIIIGGKAEQALRQGQSLSLGQKTFPTRSNERCRAYSTDGRFIGIIVFDATASRWQPQRVFNIEYPTVGNIKTHC